MFILNTQRRCYLYILYFVVSAACVNVLGDPEHYPIHLVIQSASESPIPIRLQDFYLFQGNQDYMKAL